MKQQLSLSWVRNLISNQHKFRKLSTKIGVLRLKFLNTEFHLPTVRPKPTNWGVNWCIQHSRRLQILRVFGVFQQPFVYRSIHLPFPEMNPTLLALHDAPMGPQAIFPLVVPTFHYRTDLSPGQGNPLSMRRLKSWHRCLKIETK